MTDRALPEGSIQPATQRVRDVYRRVAPFYDGFRAAWSRLTRPIELELDRLFRERIGPEARILELGPGTGINVARLLREAPRFASYLGIDASEDMLARAQPRAQHDPRVVLHFGDATNLSAIEGGFDFIVCAWMLSHLDDPAGAVRTALAKLTPGGTAVFVFFSQPTSVPLRWILGALGHVFRYRLLEPGLLTDLAFFETSSACAAGMATLSVFRRPPGGEGYAESASSR